MNLDRVLDLLRKGVLDASGPVAWARAHCVSPSYVTDVLARRYEPGKKLLDALGLEKCPAEYRRKKT